MQKLDKSKTIEGYYHQRIFQPHFITGTETDFLIQVKKNASENLYLIAGDPFLELQAKTIDTIAVQELLVEPWHNVHSWIRDLQDAIVTHFGERKCAVFIDCNPSFSSYTEQALLAADRLIVH